MRPLPVLVASLALASGAAWALLPRGSRTRAGVAPSAAELRAADIGFYQARIARDPGGAIDLVKLGALYLERFRAEGFEADAAHARRAAESSLSHRADRNAAAWQLLTAALLAEHRFLEAKTAATQLAGLEPAAAAAQAILGEVLLELGEYPAAERIFRRLTPQRFTLALAPRYARWLELTGRAAEARRLLEWARDQVAKAGSATETLAWYELRLGELALRFGALAEARARISAGLALNPTQWRLLAAAGRIAYEGGAYADAVTLGDSSLAQHLDPATLALVGDAWRAQGDSTAAEQYYRALESATQAPPGGFHRAWYLALLDHDRRVPEVLAAVERDLFTLRDVYGYDLVAWARYKSGRVPEAKQAMARALSLGTEDPLLHRHARTIAGTP